MNDQEARLLARAFSLGTPIDGAVSVARGEMGRVWRLDTDRGRYAVKELFYPSDDADAQADVAFQHAALDAGLPMPRPITRPDGRVLLELERPGGAMVAFRAYQWVELAAPSCAPAPGVAAALLARLHALDRQAETPMDPWFAEPLGAERWVSLVDAVRTAAPPWSDAFERLAPGAEAAEAIVSAARLDRWPMAELRRCHLDFNPENVLLDVAGQPVILDWENSGPAPYEQELAYAILDFAAGLQAASDFLRAYHDAGGPADIVGREIVRPGDRGAEPHRRHVRSTRHRVDDRRATRPDGVPDRRAGPHPLHARVDRPTPGRAGQPEPWTSGRDRPSLGRRPWSGSCSPAGDRRASASPTSCEPSCAVGRSSITPSWPWRRRATR